MIPGMELAGGRVMPLNEMRTVLSNIPPGDIRAVVPNITPDPETGIGRWTDAQISTAIREGRRPDGSIIGPPMSVTSRWTKAGGYACGRSKGDRTAAPIVRVEIYIRRRFVKLALHHFDGCHPRRGAWGLCQQSGTGHDDGQSGESRKAFIVTPYADGWHREARHRPRSLYEAFTHRSAGNGGCSHSDRPTPARFGAIAFAGGICSR